MENQIYKHPEKRKRKIKILIIIIVIIIDINSLSKNNRKLIEKCEKKMKNDWDAN